MRKRILLCGGLLTASLLAHAAPADQAVLEQVRSLLDELGNPAGATLRGSLLVIRLLDHDNQHLQHTLQRLWHVLRPAVLGLPACPPRIWAT